VSADERPTRSYAVELQHERTALAWERAAFSLMGIGIVLARFAAFHDQVVLVVAGLALVVIGTGLIAWAQITYEVRGRTLRRGDDVAHPGATRLVGVTATLACGLCVAAGLLAV
jgi:uncharacterized membrane protein YidH (DUF202 family)